MLADYAGNPLCAFTFVCVRITSSNRFQTTFHICVKVRGQRNRRPTDTPLRVYPRRLEGLTECALHKGGTAFHAFLSAVVPASRERHGHTHRRLIAHAGLERMTAAPYCVLDRGKLDAHTMSRLR